MWKCENCECGPCYTECKGKCNGRSVEPLKCPNFGSADASPEWVFLKTLESLAGCDTIRDWMYNAGMENAPEAIYDAVFGCGIEVCWDFQDKVLKALKGLRKAEDSYLYLYEIEELQKGIAKIPKIDLLIAAYHEAFKAGIAYGEMLRQEENGPAQV